MLSKSNLTLYCDSYNGNDENDGLSKGKPVKTITKAILLANKRRFISGSLIYIYLRGEFNVRNEAAEYIDKKDSDGNYIYNIIDTNTKFHNNYALNIYHPDMVAPSYMRIGSYNSNEPAKIIANLSSTNIYNIGIAIYCSTIFNNILFDAGVPHSLYDPNRLLSISLVSAEFNNDKDNNANIIEPKYSKNINAYSKNDISASFLLGCFSDKVDYYNCSCYNFMTAFSNSNIVKNCYFENGYMCIETNKSYSTKILGLSGYNIYSVSHIWLNGVEYIANDEEYLTYNFNNLREFISKTDSGFNILLNLYFSYVGYYDKNTLRLADSINDKPVNRITDNYNIYKYCSSYVCNNKSTIVEHTTVDYIDFICTFLYGQKPSGSDLSAKYQTYKNYKLYGGILNFKCGDYATSAIIFKKSDTENRYICYFPFLELLFNIIRENNITINSLYNGYEYSTTYSAYKLSDIVAVTSDGLSIDYSKFTISAYKDLFDNIY